MEVLRGGAISYERGSPVGLLLSEEGIASQDSNILILKWNIHDRVPDMTGLFIIFLLDSDFR